MKHSANTCLCRSVARRTENASTDQVVILVTAVAAYSITTVITAFQLTEVNRIGNNAIITEDAKRSSCRSFCGSCCPDSSQELSDAFTASLTHCFDCHR